eukprot:2217725-Prymnesium_polylepis.1
MLYDELRYSSQHYARLYFLLFQLAVTRSQTLERARRYVSLARDHRKRFLGEGVACEELKRLEQYVRSPDSHQAFLAAG